MSIVVTLALPDTTMIVFAINVAILPLAILNAFRHREGGAG